MKIELITQNLSATVVFHEGIHSIKKINLGASDSLEKIQEILTAVMYRQEGKVRINGGEEVNLTFLPANYYFTEVFAKKSENSSDLLITIFLQEILVFNKLVEPEQFQFRRYFKTEMNPEDEVLKSTEIDFKNMLTVNNHTIESDKIISSIINGNTLKIIAFLEPDEYLLIEKELKKSQEISVQTTEKAWCQEFTDNYKIVQYYEYQLETGDFILELGEKN